MIPYLLIKRKQAEAGVFFQSRKVSRGGKYKDPDGARKLDQVDYEIMKDLKKTAIMEIVL